MTNNDNATAARRYARETREMVFILPDRPADRSRNGQRAPRSVKHRAFR